LQHAGIGRKRPRSDFAGLWHGGLLYGQNTANFPLHNTGCNFRTFSLIAQGHNFGHDLSSKRRIVMAIKIITYGLAIVTGVLLSTISAQAGTIEFEGASWEYRDNDTGQVKNETFLGRNALYVSRNRLLRQGDNLRDMIIEYEYASSHPSGFIGVNFRSDPDGTGTEQFYTRPHQSGQPDASQYVGAINGLATWQLHAGPNDATAVDLPAREWIKVRIVAIGDKADIFVGDMSTPLLHVPDLRFDGDAGQTSLYASDRFWMKDTGAYFSNIIVRAATAEDKVIGTPKEVDPLPTGLVDKFEVSASFSEEEMTDRYFLKGLDAQKGEWSALSVETDGVANLARIQKRTKEANTALVRFKIKSDTKTNRLMSFGYSDRVKLFVDGKLVYGGNAQWRARDHRFLGTIALVDQIALDLPKGETEIVAAVSETFGGWGFKAQIEDQTGLTISP
jgi:hypothetical protein